ncbi:MAG: terminase small subunit [Dehalococcoidia bacterium]
MIVNRATLAEMFGISTPRVDRMVKRGCPYLAKPVDGRGEWQFDTGAVLRWQLAQRGTPEDQQDREARHARVRDAVAKADLREMERDELAAQLITPADAAKIVKEGNDIVRAVMRRFPGKVIERMKAGGLTPAPNALELLTAEVEEILALLDDAPWENAAE